MIAYHPITPPPELVQKWTSLANEEEGYEVWNCFALWAAQWGADQELKACCDVIYIHEGQPLCGGTAEWLRAARRPKPPSLAEEAIQQLDDAVMRGDCITTTEAMPALRHALERPQQLEGQQ